DGNFTPDDTFPGTPGTAGDNDGQKAQALFFLDLPKGVVTMGVNSDDGFRTTAGQVQDALAAIFLGEFDGGRGAADTIFKFVVQDAGVFPFRVIWENGGGGFNIEIFTVKTDGTKVLVNDTANGGLKAYRAKVGGNLPANPYVKSIAPAPGPTGVPNQPTFQIELVDGAAKQVDANSLKLKVLGADVAATVKKTGDTTSATYTPATEFDPESTVNAQLSFA